MKIKILISVVSIFILLSFTLPESDHKLGSTVYVCGKSKIYHPVKSHAALKRCKSGIKSITEAAAKKKGKRICRCKY